VRRYLSHPPRSPTRELPVNVPRGRPSHNFDEEPTARQRRDRRWCCLCDRRKPPT
jgi:hypothetical protein